MNLRDRLNAALKNTYVLNRELGGGGMSTVFVGEETALGRAVVLKVLPPELAADVSQERFRREVLLAARLQHPHIVPILSAGEADGLLYYTMPLIEGETLRSRLSREGELPVADVIRVLSCVADAIAYAHSHNVVHRDIKPENILLTGQHAVVTDFGVAKALGDAVSGTDLTATGLAIGTAVYMAPEQIAADPAVDHRVDIYALGIVAYELLAGATPFTGRTAQQLAAAHMTQQPEAITSRRAAVPAGLATLVMQCLEKRPADRPQSAERVARELSQLATSGGHPAARKQSMRTRRPVFTALGILGVIGLAVAAYAAFTYTPANNSAARKKVVVAVLANETGDKTLDSFGKMAADWVTQGLQETEFIDVVDSRTVLQASQQMSQAPLLKTLSTQTGAGIVVGGSYYTELDSLIVRIQIVDASDGKVLGTVSVGRVSRHTPTVALELLRERVLGALAPLVDPRLATWETNVKPPSYAAYRAYVSGLEEYVAQASNLSYEIPAALFAEAVRHDSTFQSARLWQAFNLFLVGWTTRPAFLSPADSVLRVLALHQGDLNANDRRFYKWFLALRRSDMPGTYVGAKEMMSGSPGSAHAMWEVALASLRTNRPKEALQLLDRPELSQRPAGSLALQSYGHWKAATLHLLGKYDEELKVARTHRAPLQEARALAALGNSGAALEVAQSFANGTTAADLGQTRQMVEEMIAHGDSAGARTLATRRLDAYLREPRSVGSETFFLVPAANILYAVGRFEEASRILAPLREVDSASFPTIAVELNAIGLLGALAARTSDRSGAQAMASRLEARELDAIFKPVASYWLARIAAAMGDNAAAVIHLRRAIAEGFLPVPAGAGRFFHADPDLRQLQSIPEFKTMTQPKG